MSYDMARVQSLESRVESPESRVESATSQHSALSTQHSAPGASFWEGPLGYPQAALVIATAVAIGIFFHYRVGYALRVTPTGIGGSAGALVLALAIWVRRWPDHRVLRWLTGVPFAICAMIAVGLLAAVGAVVPSRTLEARFGIDSVYASWPFLMAMAVLLTNLLGVTARRCWPLNYANLCFTLSHLGLAVAILGGLVSAAGLERANLVLYAGEPKQVARAADGRPVRLPFEATLKQFRLESFAPTLALAAEDRRKEDGFAVTPGNHFVQTGTRERIGGYNLEVRRFLPRAARIGEEWRAVNLPTCAPAALVAARDAQGKIIGEGWVSCGSVDTPGEVLPLSAQQAIYMPAPRPKEFRSTVLITQNGRTETREIRVNHPVSVGAFRLYQLSYDEKMGAASEYSVIEVVQDRGLPVVYAGMFLLLGGALLMLWNGVKPE